MRNFPIPSVVRLTFFIFWVSIGLAQSVAPPQLVSLGGAGTVETGQRVALSPVFASGSSQPTDRFQWRKNGADLSGATSESYVIEAAAVADAGTYAVTVSNANGTTAVSGNLVVRPPAPIIFTTPPRTQIAPVGTIASFSFSATGSFPRSYQWRKDGANIAGATQIVYDIRAVTNADAGSYTVAVSNSEGTATSATAILTVTPAIPIVFSFSFIYTALNGMTLTQGATGSISVTLSSGSSPLSYQWFKDGQLIAGATSFQIVFAPTKLTDAGKYSVAVTNPAGTETSREIALTVRPATPLVFANQPLAQFVFQGQSAEFSVDLAAGSSPVAYQWSKDGVPRVGATAASLRLDPVKLTDAGAYTLVATNAAGPLTSAPAVLTVIPAVLPAITRQPVGATLLYNGALSLSATVTGIPPLTLAWFRDTTRVGEGRSDYSVSNATPVDSGDYTLVVTNAAGSATSTVARVTVSPPAAPVITLQPASLSVATGFLAGFRIGYSALGAGSVSTEWFKNGRAVPGTLSSDFGVNSSSPIVRSFSLPKVSADDEGDYSVVLTGKGGTVTSQTAHLTVLSGIPPSVDYWPREAFASLGGTAQFSFGPVAGSPLLSIQWFKNGAPLPGATSSTLDLDPVTDTDFGPYSATISNPGGVIASPDFALRRYASAKPPWLAADQFSNFVYFLAASPNRIERYDLATERWLPATLLTDPRPPTAFLPTAEGVYLAYGRSLTRRTLDLVSETPVANDAYDIIALFTTDQYLYYTTSSPSNSAPGSATNSLRRSTLEAGADAPTVVQSAVFLPGRRQLFAATNSGSGPRLFPVDPQGRLSTPVYYGALGVFPAEARAFLFPGETYVANGAGTIFRFSDMTYAGSLGNRPDDIAFLADGTPVVLRDRTLQSIDPATFFAKGKSPDLPFRGRRAFPSGSNVIVFGAPATAGSTTFQIAKVAVSALTKPALPVAVIAPTERYSIGEDNLVHILSRSRRALIRWSPVTHAFLSPLPLRGAPTFASQTNPAKRALLGYYDGVLTAVPLRAATTAENQLNTVGNELLGLTDLGSMFMVDVYPGNLTQNLRLALDQQGQALATQSSIRIDGGMDAALGVGWEPARRRFYYGPETIYDENNRLSSVFSYSTIQSDGVINGLSGHAKNISRPVRFNADATFLATGNGRIFDSDLTPVGVLANDVLDAAWLPADLFTLRSFNGESQVQRWSRSNYLLTGATSVVGTPVRLFRLSDTQLVVITNAQGHPAFTILNADLTVAGAATSPSEPDFSGIYFAKITSILGGAALGDMALYVRPDRSAVLLVHSTGTPGERVATLTVNADGSFTSATSDAVLSTLSQPITGSVTAAGSWSGNISGTDTSFSGTKTTGTAPLAGYYFAPLVNATTGGAYVIVGADGRALVIVRNAETADGGLGTLDNAGRIVVSLRNVANLTVVLDPATGGITATADRDSFATARFAGLRDDLPRTDRLANISTRGRAGPGDDVMIAGFVLSGATPRPVLIRAIGPSLGTFGVPGTLADPRLTLYRGATKLAENDNWSATGDLPATTTRLGGFALVAGSADAALLLTLDPGAYTAQVGAPDGAASGTALVEVYDAGSTPTPGAPAPRLINIATRGRLAAADESLIAGIVVTGNAPKRILIRAIGPGLAAFGVPGTLPDPQLTLTGPTGTLATNDDWTVPAANAATGAEIAAAAVSVGAFALPANSKDACLLLTLAPGNYTAQVLGKTATGIALVEVYEVAP